MSCIGHHHISEKLASARHQASCAMQPRQQMSVCRYLVRQHSLSQLVQLQSGCDCECHKDELGRCARETTARSSAHDQTARCCAQSSCLIRCPAQHVTAGETGGVRTLLDSTSKSIVCGQPSVVFDIARQLGTAHQNHARKTVKQMPDLNHFSTCVNSYSRL